MNRRIAAVAIAAASIAWRPALAVLPDAQAPAEPRRGEILNMVRQDCGSCHGLTMRGGLGPPLLPAALAGKDAEQLRHVVLEGRRGTAMPPWRRFLDEAEAAWVVEQLRAGLPRE
jgi:cytochrome c55X